jgi:hypothetical protein
MVTQWRVRSMASEAIHNATGGNIDVPNTGHVYLANLYRDLVVWLCNLDGIAVTIVGEVMLVTISDTAEFVVPKYLEKALDRALIGP